MVPLGAGVFVIYQRQRGWKVQSALGVVLWVDVRIITLKVHSFRMQDCWKTHNLKNILVFIFLQASPPVFKKKELHNASSPLSSA